MTHPGGKPRVYKGKLTPALFVRLTPDMKDVLDHYLARLRAVYPDKYQSRSEFVRELILREISWNGEEHDRR